MGDKRGEMKVEGEDEMKFVPEIFFASREGSWVYESIVEGF